jgi:predicted nucleic acid-binding protein
MDRHMTKYSDLPMDFADASLVAVAERMGLSRVFTLDRSDFSVYRRNGRSPFEIIGPIPEPKRG